MKEELAKKDLQPQLKHYDKVIFEQQLAKNNELGNAYMYLGDLYDLTGRYAEALETYNKSKSYFTGYNKKLQDKLRIVESKINY